MIRRVAVEVRVLSTGHCSEECPWLRDSSLAPTCSLFEKTLDAEKPPGGGRRQYQRLEVCEDAEVKTRA